MTLFFLLFRNVLCYIERSLYLYSSLQCSVCIFWTNSQRSKEEEKKKFISVARFGDAGAGSSPFFFLAPFFFSSLSQSDLRLPVRENPGRPYRKNPAGKGRDLDQPSSTWLTSLGSYFFLCCWARLSRPPSSSLHPLFFFLASCSPLLSLFFPSSQVGYLRSISLCSQESLPVLIQLYDDGKYSSYGEFFSYSFLIYYRILFFFEQKTIGAGGSVTLCMNMILAALLLWPCF